MGHITWREHPQLHLLSAEQLAVLESTDPNPHHPSGTEAGHQRGLWAVVDTYVMQASERRRWWRR